MVTKCLAVCQYGTFPAAVFHLLGFDDDDFVDRDLGNRELDRYG